MTSEGLRGRSFRWVVAAGLLLSLAANLPGHMSVDSVIALEEARSGVRQTWAPAAFSGVLHLFDALLAGTGLYVTASSAVLFGSWMALPGLRPRTAWTGVLVAAAALLTPQLMIYQGVVWRDVLFANVTIAGFVLIARAAALWPVRRAWLSLAAAAVCLALGAAVRQNGVVLVLAAAVALAWVARGGGWRAPLGWGLGGFAVTVALAFAINAAAQPGEVAGHLRPGAEALILEHYDVVGALAHDPSLPLGDIAAADPAAAAAIRAGTPRIYSPARVDTLDSDAAFRHTLWHVPDAAMNAQWRDVVTRHPGPYLAHRLAVFEQLFLTPDLQACLPVQVGVSGPVDMMDDLDLDGRLRPQDKAARAYAQRFFATPVYSHLTWAVVALLCAGAVLWRRERQDIVIAGLLLGALAFAASFLVISVACDYRYLYLLDLAALTGLAYLALDPPLRRRLIPPP